jgi:hypothetical protein
VTVLDINVLDTGGLDKMLDSPAVLDTRLTPTVMGRLLDASQTLREVADASVELTPVDSVPALGAGVTPGSTIGHASCALLDDPLALVGGDRAVFNDSTAAIVTNVLQGSSSLVAFIEVQGYVHGAPRHSDVVARIALVDGHHHVTSLCFTDERLVDALLAPLRTGPRALETLDDLPRRSPYRWRPTNRRVAAIAVVFSVAAGAGVLALVRPWHGSGAPVTTASTAPPPTVTARVDGALSVTPYASFGAVTTTSVAATDETADTTTQPPSAPITAGVTPTLVYSGEGADPFLLSDATGTYVYATNSDLMNIPVLDVSTGTRIDALPQLPEWSRRGNAYGKVWAPTVAKVDDSYVMWYTTKDAASNRQCISVARSAKPTGPFVDTSSAPAICPMGDGGAIDPSVFTDVDGSLHLLYKTDGNCCGLATHIETVTLSSDGTRVMSSPMTLLTGRDAGAKVIEAPSMSVRDGRYHLLYSTGDWKNASYQTGHAICTSLTGPCTIDNKRVLDSWTGGVGAGGAAYSNGATGSMVVFHAWENDRPSYRSGGRRQTWVISADALT